MSFLDSLTAPFGTSAQTNAANSITGSIQTGLDQLNSYYGQGQAALTPNYLAGIAPFQQAYGQAQPGIKALQGALGLSGPIGTSVALQQLQSTPGFQFSLTQGDNAIKAQNAATGGTGSGNEATALSNYNQGLAGTTYNNYVNQLQPWLNQQLGAAGGVQSGYTGLGGQLNNSFMGQGNAAYGGNATIGNANAMAALAPLTAGANMWGLGTGLLGGLAGSSGATSALSNIGKGLGSGISELFSLSDRRIKDDIEEVGKLNDGLHVYKFRYKGDSRPQIGLMAQEVEKHYPDAVAEIDGVKFVDYGRATSRAAELQAFMR